MDSAQIHLPGSRIESIVAEADSVRINFSRAYIIKSMTGSPERTRWWQAGALILDGVESVGSLPQGPLVCAGGDIDENVYTYRDMLPIPFASRGHARVLLRFENADDKLDLTGSAIRLDLVDVPRYIEHIRPGAGG